MKIHEALTICEKEQASGWEGPRSGVVSAGECLIRRHQRGRVLDQVSSARESA